MISIKSVYKDGRKIIGYECIDDNGNTARLTKDKVAELIRNGVVSNAKVQRYNGNDIIRLQKDVPVKSGTIVKNEAIKNESIKKDVTNKQVGSDIINVEEMFNRKCREFGIIPDTKLKEGIVKEKTIKLMKALAYSLDYGDIMIIPMMGIYLEVNYKKRIYKQDIKGIKNKNCKLTESDIKTCREYLEMCIEKEILENTVKKMKELESIAFRKMLDYEKDGIHKMEDIKDKRKDIIEKERAHNNDMYTAEEIKDKFINVLEDTGWRIEEFTPERIRLNYVDGGYEKYVAKDVTFTQEEYDGTVYLLSDDDMTDIDKREYSKWVEKLRNGAKELKHADTWFEGLSIGDKLSLSYYAGAVYNFRGIKKKDIDEVLNRLKLDL